MCLVPIFYQKIRLCLDVSLLTVSGAYYFHPQGYNNPSFDQSSENHRPSNADNHDESSSDNDSSANTPKDTK
jgi:hypothetical protein